MTTQQNKFQLRCRIATTKPDQMNPKWLQIRRPISNLGQNEETQKRRRAMVEEEEQSGG
ncbi:uncharacterized protein G2W53_028646 [Senna tora]|uniref:Uncharacterized protein n=1 Tax=Senna tora TaxID=362788 RepID=A0A834T3W7_9FABA|nr:uncharacterized protein G2W53_028646 [Senna tora]